jgi:asparagine synthase (glutamine-hydrolysing)
MSYRYLAFIRLDGAQIEEISPGAEMTLRDMGMTVCFRSEVVTLFVSTETPALPVAGGGILIGHLFTRDGTSVRDEIKAASAATDTQIRQQILTNFWGAYLLVQTDAQANGQVTITRDPSASGEVRCIYAIKNGIGFVTSDISLATRLNLYRRSIDWDFIIHRLSYPGLKMQRTGLADVCELLPGCSLTLRGSSVSTGQEWSPWDFVTAEQRYDDLQQAAVAIRTAVTCVVRTWATTDKSILLELSGGLDSSVVAACLYDSPARVVCCNLVTPVPGADEREYAGLVAQALRVKLHTEELTFERACFDVEPPSDSVVPGMGPLQHAIDATMEVAAQRHGTASYFSGGGGDTVFCYLRTTAPAVDAFRVNGIGAACAAIRDLAALHQCTLWTAGRLALSKLLRAPKSPYDQEASFIAPSAIDGTPEAHPWLLFPAHALPGDRERIFDLSGNQMFQDQLPRGTKRRMRLPLLSQPVMEACLRAPSWMWIAGGLNRAVARTAFQDRLPAAILRRQSKGTFMSYLGAVYEKNKSHLSDFLMAGHLASRGLLDTDALKRFFDARLPPRDRSFLRVIQLSTIENWIRHQP